MQLRLADLELDLASRKVTRAGQRVDLTAKEFTLLSVLRTIAHSWDRVEVEQRAEVGLVPGCEATEVAKVPTQREQHVEDHADAEFPGGAFLDLLLVDDVVVDGLEMA